ncbi:glycosyltransferase family 4 protein [Eubacteriales bacterium mix99]|jgi:glycosyltransferase involved in cell wall biosynthesis
MKIMELVRKAEGGMKEHAVLLIRGLLQSGHQVIVLCDFPRSDLASLEKAGAQVIAFRFPGTIQPLQDARKIAELYSLLRRVKPDLLHCHGFKAGLIGRMAGWMSGCPLVYTVHNMVLHGRGKTGRFLICRFEKWMEQRTDAIICVSRALKDSMTGEMGLHPEPIRVIRNPRPEWDTGDGEKVRRQYGIRGDNILIGTVARLIPSKGIHFLLEAVPSVLDRYPCAVLMITGSGPEETSLKNLAERPGIAGRVIFTGQVHNIWDYYAAFDLFVLPTLSEGLAMTLLEAMSFGLPIIASAVGGTPELITHGKNGYLIQPGRPLEIRDALQYCLDHPQIAISYGRQAREDVRHGYSREKMIKETIAVLESVLEKKRPNA